MMSAPPSPDSKKKKPALPSLLSNLRNARQAVVGRASDAAEDFLYERELRPLTGGGGGSSGALGLLGSNSTGGGGPQHLQRGAVGGSGGGVGGIGNASSSSMSSNSTTLSTTLQSFSQRFGNKFRGGGKSRSRRKKGSGVTTVPQEFYIAVGCFFFVFPIFFIIYIYIAGHSVFGDGSDGGHQVQILDQKDEGYGVLNHTDLDSQFVAEDGDYSQGRLIEDEIMGKLHDRDDSTLGVDSLGQHSKMKLPFSKRNIDSSLMEDNALELKGDEEENTSAMKVAKPGKFQGTSNSPNTLTDPEREAESGKTRSSLDQHDGVRRT